MKDIFSNKFSKIDWLVVRIVVIYLSFGLFWIFFSDFILAKFVADKTQFAQYSLYKGWAYVIITSVLLFFLVRKTLHQQSRIESSLQVSEERWKFALEGAGHGVWDWNVQTNEVFRSARWHEIYGYAEHELETTAEGGRKLIHPEDRARAVEDIEAYLHGKTPLFISEFRLLCKGGSWKWTLSRGMLISSTADGKPLRMIGTHTDISERKHSEAQVFHLAHYDSITGLPNRVLFLDRFEQDIKKAKRNRSPLTLMYLDLDRFKEVNDTLGHDVGDVLLKQAAQRLLKCVRHIDTVARLGGDEFTIILNNLNNSTDVERLAQEVLNTLEQPFYLDREVVYLTTSLGITIYPDDGGNVDVLVKNADQAMYAAKDQGGNRYSYFTPSMQQAAVRRMRIANDLRAALAAGQFVVYYQPIVEFSTGAIRKAEALIRWQHPERGLVSPAEFIPIAEDTGLIIEIGDFVFTQAAVQAAKWRAHRPDFQISINKSPVQFKHGRVLNVSWIDHLQSLALAGNSLVVEITEGLLLDAQDSVIRQLQAFHEAGLEIAIDDFGTGYSSLAYLRKFDIDYVKIDQSFTRNIQAGSNDMVLCKAIIVMAHKLGMKVIAEGVETRVQHDLLLTAGCDYAQGFLFSKAVPAHEFEQFLQPGWTWI